MYDSVRGYYIHIRRGLRSCLSKRGGKFEGLDCEISSEYGSHASFYICSLYIILLTFLQEVAGAEGNSPLLIMHCDQTHNNRSPHRSVIDGASVDFVHY